MNLSKTIIHGSLEAVREQLEREENINYVDQYGYTPLIETAIVDDIEKGQLLIDAGADPNQKDITGRSPLHWTISNSNYELTQLLLERGADANAFHMAGEPVLVKPLLRRQDNLKTLLMEHGARTAFAYDYIYAKLTGHRFELVGSVDITNPDGIFIEVDYEGFYLEFCLNLISDSLNAFQNNFAARILAPWFNSIKMSVNAFTIYSLLTRYDHYLLEARKYRKDIMKILSHHPMLLPISQEGHAVVIIKYQNLFAICDRSQEMCSENELPIYYINTPSGLTTDLILDMVYDKQELPDIYAKLHRALKLRVIDKIPMKAQAIGNCSWANVEAAIPILHWMQQVSDANNKLDKSAITQDSLELFQRWKQWDKQRALQRGIQAFYEADRRRKASIAALLADVLFQCFSADNPGQFEYAAKIIRILKTEGYEYILQTYLQHYVYNKSTKAGKNLMRLLKAYESFEI